MLQLHYFLADCYRPLFPILEALYALNAWRRDRPNPRMHKGKLNAVRLSYMFLNTNIRVSSCVFAANTPIFMLMKDASWQASAE